MLIFMLYNIYLINIISFIFHHKYGICGLKVTDVCFSLNILINNVDLEMPLQSLSVQSTLRRERFGERVYFK